VNSDLSFKSEPLRDSEHLVVSMATSSNNERVFC